jgi:diaminopimelate decarboxylase
MPSARAKSTARSRRGTSHTADTFDQDALSLTVDIGIHVNCGSPDMIDQLGRRAPGRDITLRINLGFGHGHSQKTNTGGDHSKHGIWHEQLPEVLALAARHGLKVTGLHMHIGSGTDLEHLSRVCGAIERRARQFGPSISTISVSGGLPIAYRSDDPRVLGIVEEKLSSHSGTALSAAATNVLVYFSTISSKVGSPRRTHGEHLASESRSSPSFVRRSRCRMSVETSPGW